MEKYIQGEKVMAIFKPEGSTLSGNFQGIVEVGIINFTNRAG